jgi:hypothetical protein
MLRGVGKESTTGNLSAAQPDAPATPGKQSLVEKEFGAPVDAASGPRKREHDELDDSPEGADPTGAEHKRQNRGSVPERAGFHYSIATGEVGSLGDAAAPVSNAVQPIAPSGPRQPGPAYVGSVITVAKGKDKKPVDVARQYEAEAFDTPAEARNRFALVVGVNRMESVTSHDGGQAELATEAMAGVQAFTGFPTTAFLRLWRPVWIDDDTGAAGVPLDTVRAAATRFPDAATEAEKHRPPAPVGPMRTATAHHASTTQYRQDLQQRFDDVYVQVGDADAVNLKAKATPADPERGLFNRYDQVIGDAKQRTGQSPLIATGGYRFRVDDKYAAYHGGQTHPDPHAGEAGKVAPQTAKAADLDMKVREAAATVHPGVPYMPEPNLLVHSSQVDKADFGPAQNDESRALVRSIADGKPSVAWARQNMVFDTRAALYTDGKRFNEAMLAGDAATGYGAGKTDAKGLFNATRTAQSMAPNRPMGNMLLRETFTKGAMDGRVHDMRQAYTPHVLRGFEGDDESRAPVDDAAMPVDGNGGDASQATGPVQELYDGITSLLREALSSDRYTARSATKGISDDAKKKVKSNARAATDEEVAVDSKDRGDVAFIEQALRDAHIAFPNALARTRRDLAVRLNIARRAGGGLIQRETGDVLGATHPSAATAGTSSRRKGKGKAQDAPAVSDEQRTAANQQARAKVDDILAMLSAIHKAIVDFLSTFEARPEDPALVGRANAPSAAAPAPPASHPEPEALGELHRMTLGPGPGDDAMT